MHTLGKYAILYYYVHRLVHVCELLKGTHHNTQGPRNRVGVAGSEVHSHKYYRSFSSGTYK